MADSDITIEILKGIRSELRDFRQETSDFRQETNQRFGGVEDRLGEVEGRLGEVDGRLWGRRASSRGSGRTSRAHERTTGHREPAPRCHRIDAADGGAAATRHGPGHSHERAGRHGNRGARQRSRDARREARNAVTSSPRMPRPFAAPGTRTHFVGDRPARLEHVRLEWDLDLARKRLSGTATLTLIARRDRLTALDLRRRRAGRRGGDRRRARGRRSTTTARSCASSARTRRPRAPRWRSRSATRCQPRRGLYFIGPNADHPERALQCWTQGQDDDSRYYWPCIDHPIEKFTTEVICAAPAGNFVLSNGVLRERTGAARRAACAGTTRSSSPSPPTW